MLGSKTNRTWILAATSKKAFLLIYMFLFEICVHLWKREDIERGDISSVRFVVRLLDDFVHHGPNGKRKIYIYQLSFFLERERERGEREREREREAR